MNGVFACIMRSSFNRLTCNIICFCYVVTPGSLNFSYAFVCVCFSCLKGVWAMFLGDATQGESVFEVGQDVLC